MIGTKIILIELSDLKSTVRWRQIEENIIPNIRTSRLSNLNTYKKNKINILYYLQMFLKNNSFEGILTHNLSRKIYLNRLRNLQLRYLIAIKLQKMGN